MGICRSLDELLQSIKRNPDFSCDNCQMFACSYALKSKGCISNTVGIWRRALKELGIKEQPSKG
jgi:hypothetical protein